MIVLPFSTADTDIATGRARVLGAINAQCAALGIGSLFPADAATRTHIHLEVPGAAIQHLAPAPYRAALAADTIVVDTSDGLTARPGATVSDPPVITGYRFDMLVRPRRNPALDAALTGIITAPWQQASDTQRLPTAEELALDPGRPVIVWRETNGVRFHGLVPPRFPKHAFA